MLEEQLSTCMEQLEHAESKWIENNTNGADDIIKELEDEKRLLQQQYWALEQQYIEGAQR